MQQGNEVYQQAFRDGWKPDPRLSVSDWADRYRYIGSSDGRVPTKWHTSTTPFARDIMDALGPRHPARRVVFIKGSQISGTESGNNWLGFIVHQMPGPVLILRPTIDEARRFSHQRLDPMIEETEALAKLVQPARARDGSNTTLAKQFPGGFFFLIGSNSATGLKSLPARYLFCDEIDEYPGDVDGQGDPIALAEKRLSGPNFARRKVFLVSTPTVKGLSRIEDEFLHTDQRRYFVPCPHCGHYDWMRWENIKYDRDDDGEVIPPSVQLVCVECACMIEERHKMTMLPAGEWRPTAVGDPETIGFHLSSLYSPLGWFSWAAAAKEFVKTHNDPPRFKTWINTVLGETWEDRGSRVDPTTLMERAERYANDVPTGVGVLVASVDVQGDRLEVAVKGYGGGEESWLICYTSFFGDPAQQDVWRDLDEFLQGTFTHENGQEVGITCTVVDTGYHTEHVYRFCALRYERGVFAIKGGNEYGKPLVGKATRNNRWRAHLFTLCVNSGKEVVYSRLRVGTVGPGYCHLPEWIDQEYIAQLTAEKAIPVFKKGRGTVREWHKTRERNEALDLEVYALAALYILGPAFLRSLPQRAHALAKPPADVSEDTSSTPTPVGPRRGGWVTGWKGGT
jgi:phage terminase large subunit GpA-like protein